MTVTENPPSDPRIVRFEATPTNILPGESSTITWTTDGATTVTITFANSGWTNAAFCVASPSVSLVSAPYVSAISGSSVTFTTPALTGILYYHCDGN